MSDFHDQIVVLAEYFESKLEDKFVKTAKKKPSGIAKKNKPKLWERCKVEAVRKLGGKHSARAMQLALKLYKKRGGGFVGKKPTAATNKMKKWTKQKWMYLSDFKKKKKRKMRKKALLQALLEKRAAKKNPGRYLPEAKWKALTPEQRKATDQKKRREGKKKQYVSNTEAAKVRSKKKYYSKK